MSDRKVSTLQKFTIDALVAEYNGLIDALGQTGVLLHHEEAADSEKISTADATDLTTVVALVNEIRTDYIAHIASTAKHSAADTTNTVTAAAATDQATVNTLANELKTDISAHDDDAGHRGAGGEGSTVSAPVAVTTANATDLATSLTLVNALKVAYNKHIKSGAQALDVSGN